MWVTGSGVASRSAGAIEETMAAEPGVQPADLDEVLVGEDAALGRAGGSGGVKKRRFIRCRRPWAGCRRKFSRALVDDAQRCVGQRRANMPGVPGVGHGKRHIGVFDDVSQFLRAHGRIDRARC